MSDGGRAIFRFIGWVAGLALVAVIGIYAMLLIHNHFAKQPPDVDSIARSLPVMAADQATASAMSNDLKFVALAHATGVVTGPTATLDSCTSRQGDYVGPSWSPTTCTRSVTVYLFSRTSFHKTDYHQPLPAYNAVPGMTIGLEVRFKQRPDTDELVYVVPGSVGYGPPPEVTSWIQRETVSPHVVDSAPFAQYPYVAAVSLTATYYDPGNLPTTGPTSNAAAGQCVSGSGNCS
jgi:hypothetical protein